MKTIFRSRTLAYFGLWTMVGMTMLLQFVVSFGFILPVNAPQNMIAYGTDTFEARDFVRTGIVITLAAVVLLVRFARLTRDAAQAGPGR